MARNAKDVERECGQFLERLERQYERAEDQQRRSKTTSATVTARMGEEPDEGMDAPKARAEAAAQEKAPRKAVEIPQAEAAQDAPAEGAAPEKPEPEPIEEKRIDAPDEPGDSAADGTYDEVYEEYGGEDYEEAGEDEGDEETGPDFAQVMKENLAKAGGLLSALGAKVKSGSKKLASRLRKEDSIEEEDFDEYEEPPCEPQKGEELMGEQPEMIEADDAPTEPEKGEEITDAQPEKAEEAADKQPEAENVEAVPATRPEAEKGKETADAQTDRAEETADAADAPADVAPIESPAAAGLSLEMPFEPEEEEFEEDAPKADLLFGLRSLFSRKKKKAGEVEEDGEEYEGDEEADEEETEEDDEEYEEDEPSVGFKGRLKSLFGRKKVEDDEDEDEDEDEYEDGEEEDDGDDASAAPINQKKERTMNMEDNQKSLSELLAEGMSDTPSLSRRERRALSAAGDGEKKNAAKDVADDLEMDLSDRAVEDEPTVEFHPVHKASRKPLDELDYEDEDEDDYDDEDEEEEEEVKTRKRREKTKKKEKKRYEEDDEDDYDDEDDDYDEDDEEDDEEDDDDEEEETSFVKRLLGFFKGLLAVALIVLLAVFALRLLEASGRVSLDWLRNGVGERLPFVTPVFPKP